MTKKGLLFFAILGWSLSVQRISQCCCPPSDDAIADYYGNPSFSRNNFMAYRYGCTVPDEPDEVYVSPRDDLLVSLINISRVDMDLFLAIYDQDFALAEECLDKGANIYFTTRDGKTPLHLLMSIVDRISKNDKDQYHKCANKMVKLGIDYKNYNKLLDMEDRYHETAYDYAVSNKAPQNIKEIVKPKNK